MLPVALTLALLAQAPPSRTPQPRRTQPGELTASVQSLKDYVGLAGGASLLFYPLRLEPGQKVRVQLTHSEPGQFWVASYTADEMKRFMRGLREPKASLRQWVELEHMGKAPAVYYVTVEDEARVSTEGNPFTLTFTWK